MGCSQLRTWRIKQNGHGRALSEYIFLAQKPKGSKGREGMKGQATCSGQQVPNAATCCCSSSWPFWSCFCFTAVVSQPKSFAREQQTREREREQRRESGTTIGSLVRSLSFSLSLSWPGFASSPLAQCRLLADCGRNVANTAHVDRVCRRLINVTLCHNRS